MPPSTQPVVYRVVSAAAAALAAMDSDGYFNPPSVLGDGTVLCKPVEPPLLQYLENMPAEVTAVYGLWGDVRTTLQEESTMGSHTASMSLMIECFVRYQPARMDVYEVSDEPEKIRGQIEHDIQKVIELEQPAQNGDMLGNVAERWEKLIAEPLYAGNFGTVGWVGMHVDTELWYHTTMGDPTAQGS